LYEQNIKYDNKYHVKFVLVHFTTKHKLHLLTDYDKGEFNTNG